RLDSKAARAMARSLEEGRYGPIEYRSYTWVGEVNDLFVEVWRLRGRPPVRKWLIKDGHSCKRLPKTVGLKISDFFPEDEWAACKISDSNVRFRPHLWDRLVLAMSWTARTRFVSFLHSLDLRNG
ncbi:hypothetical protein V1524DRAFT_368124, partial [Lipomyces starkeyi]